MDKSTFQDFSCRIVAMNFKLGLLVAAVAVLVLGATGFYVQNSIFNLKEEWSKPWIEVVTPGVFELAEDQKTEKKELFTGDELQNGAVIGLREKALANIYFPDGSVARLDSGTRLVVEAGDFEEKTNKLNIRMNLLWGRVWSKVITVLTPDSSWEVQTTNAVAVVRGTAFGVEYVEEGKSNVIGYENKVEVKLIDPATKKVMPAIAMVVEAKKVLEIKKEVIENMKAQLAAGELRQDAAAIATKAGRPLMEVKEASAKVLNQDWVKRSIEADEKLNEKMRAVREKLEDQREAVKEYRKEFQREFRGKIEERQEAVKAVMGNVETKILENREELKENLSPFGRSPAGGEETAEELKTSEVQAVISTAPAAVNPVSESNTVTATAGQVKSLAIKANRDLTAGLIESESVVFRSFTQYGDGSEKEVTLEAVWKVLGKIGFIKSPGVFVAKLEPEVSELGVVSGSVVVSWKDPKTGAVFEAASPIFKVELEIDTNFDPARG